jgi:hypothetical protein
MVTNEYSYDLVIARKVKCWMNSMKSWISKLKLVKSIFMFAFVNMHRLQWTCFTNGLVDLECHHNIMSLLHAPAWDDPIASKSQRNPHSYRPVPGTDLPGPCAVLVYRSSLYCSLPKIDFQSHSSTHSNYVPVGLINSTLTTILPVLCDVRCWPQRVSTTYWL